MKFKLYYFEDINNKCEVDEYLDSLNIKNRAKVMAWIDKLQEQGNRLHRPFADYLRDGIYELRISVSSNNLRILYFFILKNQIILSHAFIKKSSKVPEREINKAIANREYYLNKMEKKNEKT